MGIWGMGAAGLGAAGGSSRRGRAWRSCLYRLQIWLPATCEWSSPAAACPAKCALDWVRRGSRCSAVRPSAVRRAGPCRVARGTRGHGLVHWLVAWAAASPRPTTIAVYDILPGQLGSPTPTAQQQRSSIPRGARSLQPPPGPLCCHPHICLLPQQPGHMTPPRIWQQA